MRALITVLAILALTSAAFAMRPRTNAAGPDHIVPYDYYFEARDRDPDGPEISPPWDCFDTYFGPEVLGYNGIRITMPIPWHSAREIPQRQMADRRVNYPFLERRQQ
jgi:hypothetical protein